MYVERVSGEGGGKCPGQTLACGSNPSGPLAVAEVVTTNSAPISATRHNTRRPQSAAWTAGRPLRQRRACMPHQPPQQGFIA